MKNMISLLGGIVPEIITGGVLAMQGKNMKDIDNPPSIRVTLADPIKIDVERKLKDPLVAAIRDGNLEKMQNLVRDGVDEIYGRDAIELICEFWNCAIAAFNTNESLIKSLIRERMNVYSQMTELLIEKGATVRTKEHVIALLARAIRGNNLEMADLLIRHGADIDEISSDCRTTALKEAISAKNINSMLFLLRRRANVNAVDPMCDNDTPLLYTIELGCNLKEKMSKITYPVVGYATSSTYKDPGELKAIIRANMNTEIAFYESAAITLIEEGADVTIANKNGVTPLKLAQKWGNKSLIRAILEHQ